MEGGYITEYTILCSLSSNVCSQTDRSLRSRSGIGRVCGVHGLHQPPHENHTYTHIGYHGDFTFCGCVEKIEIEVKLLSSGVLT